MTPQEGIEFAPPAAVARRQTSLLRETVAYAARSSAYYRRVLGGAGVRPEDIRSPADLRRVPITTKRDLQDAGEAVFCRPASQIADVTHTSGSTGARPLVHPLTRGDLERLARNEEFGFRCAGAAPGDVFMVAVAMDDFFIAGLAYYLGLARLGACVLRAGAGDLDRQCRLLARTRVDGIVGVPSNLIRLAAFCRARGVSPAGLGVRVLVLIGETIREAGFGLNARGRLLAEAWPGAVLASTYANTEIATAFCECPAGRGGHGHPELCLAEVVDASGEPVPAGAAGDLVVTTFGAEMMPLLRYRTGDVTYIDPSPCGCGRTSPRLGPILGRRENMLKVRGVSLYPAAVEEALAGVADVADYIIVAVDGADGSDAVALHVTPAAGAAPYLAQRVVEAVREKARVTPRVEVCDVEALKGLQFGSGSRKPQRFIDRRARAASPATP